MEYLLSIDVGTGSVRAALVSTDGRVGPVAVHPITTWSPRASYYEQSSRDIWEKICQVVQEVTKDLKAEQVKGIGVDATCSLVALDSNLKPLTVSPTETSCPGGDDYTENNNDTSEDPVHNIILWMDHRAEAETEIINATHHSVLDNVGGAVSLEMETPKLLWLKTHLKETWDRRGLFFDLPDFLTWKLTGDEARSLCSLVCKWTYDAYADCWNEDYFENIGLLDLKDNDWRAIGQSVKQPGDPIGRGLSTESARVLGLNPGTPVAASMIDAHAGALALLVSMATGVSDDYQTRLGLICGTSTCHMALTSEKIFVPGVWGPYYGVVLPSVHLLEAGQSATGKLLEHVVSSHPETDIIKRKLRTEDLGEVFQYLNEIIETRNSTEMTADYHVYPDYHGNRSPLADSEMKGMVCGLTLESSVTGLVKHYLATIQSLAYGTRHILDSIQSAGKTPAISTLLVSGGLAKNLLYIQSHADITGMPVLYPHESECMLLGCGMLAANAAGVYGGMQQTVRGMASEASIVRPNTSTVTFHDKKYRVFLKLMQTQIECRKLMK